MKKQLTLAGADIERYRKPTRREKFLAEMGWQQYVCSTETARNRPGFAPKSL